MPIHPRRASDTGSVIRRYPFAEPKRVITSARDAFLIDNQGREYLDITSGYSACTALGYSHPEVLDAIHRQYNTLIYLNNIEWINPSVEELGALLTKNTPNSLNQVWFNGGSGSEAIESALKLSYLTHYVNNNQEKIWFISRDESYHGITLWANAVTNLDIYDIYDPINPTTVANIPQHNPFALKCLTSAPMEHS